MKKAVLLSTEENLLQTMNEDLLDRNKDLKNFCRLLQHQQGMSSIAIDGRWGSGKTFFCEAMCSFVKFNEFIELFKYRD